MGVLASLGALVAVILCGALLMWYVIKRQRQKGRSWRDVVCLLIAGPCRRNIDPAFSFTPSNDATDVDIVS